MVFSSFSFLLVFFPAVLACYFLVPKKHRALRNTVLLIFSLGFYFVGEPRGILVMLFVVVLCYSCALLLGRCRGIGRRLWLIVSIVGCIGVICFYKYLGFAAETVNSLFGTKLSLPAIVMPIGISFFTFQSMSYVIDVYRREVPAQKNPIYVALYVSLFPQLVAGPIVRYSTIASELTQRSETLDDFYAGLGRFILGLSKKLLLANAFGKISGTLFGLTERSALLAWLGAVFFALQIFYDFSGYSDMAIGIGRLFGFHFLENFNYPYASTSITDFWRRWHISLSTWFRDYVYIPLGGNRRGLLRQLLNIGIVWALTGLWHGASWNFVLWGLYFAVILILEKLFLKKLLDKLPKVIGHIYALLLILFGWVIFNCTSLTALGAYAADLFRFSTVNSGDWGYAWYLLRQYWPELLAGVVFCMPIVPALKLRLADKRWVQPLSSILLLLLFGLCILSLTGSGFNPFIYFRF